MKRIALLLLSLVLLLSFAACSEAPAESEAPAAEESSEAPAAEEEPTAEPVELSIYVPGSNEFEFDVYTQISEMAAADMPHMTTNITQIGWDEYFTKLNVAFSGGTAPDVFGVGLGQIGPVFASGNMMNISEAIPDWDGFDDISEASLSPAMHEGDLYGYAMPEVRVLYYRTDLFEEAGLTAPPTTVEEIRSYAEQLVQSDGSKITLSGIDIGTGEQTLWSSMLMFGADGLWNDDLTSAMTEPEALEALEWCQNIMVDGISDVRLLHDVTGGMFANGLAAMAFDGSSNATTVANNVGAENFSVANLPGDRYMLGTTCWSVYSDTDYKDEALALWQSITSTEGQLLIAEKIGFVPTRESAREDYIAMNPELNEVFFNAATKVVPYGAMNEHFFDFVNNLRPLVDEVYAGTMEPQAAMDQFATAYDEAVAAK